MQWTDVSLLLSTVQWDRYRGDAERSCAAIAKIWPWYERSPVRQGAMGRATMHALRGCANLAAARQVGVATGRRQSGLDTARQDLKTLEKIGQHPYPHLALALRTGLALAADDRAGALRELRAYANNPPPASTVVRLDVLCARRLLGQLLPGDEGRTTRETAEAELSGLGVADLDATSELVLTGCSLV
jgi:hypothetical protein